MTKTKIAMFLVFLFTLSSLLVYVPKESESQAVPDYTLTVNPAVLTLDVAPGGNPTGQVQCQIQNPSAHQIEVKVTVSGGGVTLTPPMFTVTVVQGGSVTIPIAVAAEPRSSRKFISVAVMSQLTRVDGSPSPIPVDRQSGFQVTLEQYARVVMTTQEPFKKVKPGKENPVIIRVYNDGNDPDKFEISCKNQKDLEDDGFSVVVNPPVTTDIDPKKYLEVTVAVQTPKELWLNEYFTLQFEAKSKLKGSNERVPLSMTMWVWGMYVPTFDPIFTLVAAAMIAVALKGRIKDEDEEIEEV